jgi:hypothetical protein
MYRYVKAEVGAAADSSLNDPVFGPLKIVADQTLDNESFATTIRVAPSASEAQVAIAPVTTGYFFALFSDYPVKVRLNGAMATQFTLKSNNVAAVSVGAPLPPQCCFMFNGEVTSVYLEPISSAAQTATVRIFVSGDPTSSYT